MSTYFVAHNFCSSSCIGLTAFSEIWYLAKQRYLLSSIQQIMKAPFMTFTSSSWIFELSQCPIFSLYTFGCENRCSCAFIRIRDKFFPKGHRRRLTFSSSLNTRLFLNTCIQIILPVWTNFSPKISSWLSDKDRFIFVSQSYEFDLSIQVTLKPYPNKK